MPASPILVGAEEESLKRPHRPIADRVGECDHAWVGNMVVLEVEEGQQPQRPDEDLVVKLDHPRVAYLIVAEIENLE